jgi:hypothetical protein
MACKSLIIVSAKSISDTLIPIPLTEGVCHTFTPIRVISAVCPGLNSGLTSALISFCCGRPALAMSCFSQRWPPSGNLSADPDLPAYAAKQVACIVADPGLEYSLNVFDVVDSP